jgi:hypothetical protein
MGELDCKVRSDTELREAAGSSPLRRVANVRRPWLSRALTAQQAHEDDAEQAVRAALTARERVATSVDESESDSRILISSSSNIPLCGFAVGQEQSADPDLKDMADHHLKPKFERFARVFSYCLSRRALLGFCFSLHSADRADNGRKSCFAKQPRDHVHLPSWELNALSCAQSKTSSRKS